MKDINEVKSEKTTTKRKSTNRINKTKITTKSKTQDANKKIEKKEKLENLENNDISKSSTSFNLIEVIIIMIITAIFGVLIGSCVTYFRDNVISGDNTSQKFDEFFDVYNELIDGYYGEVDQNKLIEAGIKGMVDYLGDSYSSYLNYDETYSLNEELEGEFVGMGATVSTNDDGEIYIYEIFNDSPAHKAGFKVGDIITKVDGKSVEGKTTTEVSYQIKGKENTKVDITIKRDGEEITLSLTRGKVILPSVEYSVIEQYNIGYINVSLFAKNTPEQFENAMNTLISKKVNSVIIDVRGNSGGYLFSAEKIASLFLKKNDIIYQLNTKGVIESIKATENKVYDINVVILVDGASASASEVLAAALNENISAPLVGVRTYGKGTVQKTVQLSSGSMIKYTVQEWYTPKGNKVNEIGLTPNYEIELNEKYYQTGQLEDDNQLQKAIEILKK